MSQPTTWVAVFDGALARVWEYDREGHLRERVGDGLDGRGEHARDNAGGGEAQRDHPHSGYVEQMSEPKFVEHFTARLAERARQGVFDRLIVAADPHALGYFRGAAPHELKAKVTAEIDRDYVHTPVKELEQALSQRLQLH